MFILCITSLVYITQLLNKVILTPMTHNTASQKLIIKHLQITDLSQ
jgi:hypothetical protein